MGNFIDLMSSSPQEKIRVLNYNGGRGEFTASPRVKRITSGTYGGYKLVHYPQPDIKLKPRELYFLMPQLPRPCSHPASYKMKSNNRCGSQSAKIVVTKQQLELLTSARKCQSIGSSVKFVGNVGVRGKWQPSLAVIPWASEFLES